MAARFIARTAPGAPLVDFTIALQSGPQGERRTYAVRAASGEPAAPESVAMKRQAMPRTHATVVRLSDDDNVRDADPTDLTP
jgi:hypothetical protein